MEKIKIDEIKNYLKEKTLDEPLLVIDEDNMPKGVLIDFSEYSLLADIKNELEAMSRVDVKVIPDGEFDLSYSEYETLKEQLNKALDDMFKPKAEKLN